MSNRITRPGMDDYDGRHDWVEAAGTFLGMVGYLVFWVAGCTAVTYLIFYWGR